MRISGITIKDFRRFKGLTVQDIPASSKLVIMAGPNGSGKSSLFDALLSFQRAHAGIGVMNDPLYYLRDSGINGTFHPPNNINVLFHESSMTSQEVWKKSLYVRSAYRNDPDFTLNSLSSAGRVIDQVRMFRLADNDAAVSQNYASITLNALHDFFSLPESSKQSAVEFRNSFFGKINRSLALVFNDLTLTSLGVPGESGVFFFSKGEMKDFHYKNLSGGEKASFDLLVDLIAKAPIFDNTIYCIDEPEAHLNTVTQGRLIRALYALVPENCQLWVATHAIGMIRAARDLYDLHPGTVCFLDFGGRDFDKDQVMVPEAPTPTFWRNALSVALDDLSALVSPSSIVVCEGTPLMKERFTGNADHDAKCYNQILLPLGRIRFLFRAETPPIFRPTGTFLFPVYRQLLREQA